MLQDKVFINALAVSLAFHIFMMAPLPFEKDAIRVKKPDIKTEFVYGPEKKAPIDSRLIAERQKTVHGGAPRQDTAVKRLPEASSSNQAKQQLLIEKPVNTVKQKAPMPANPAQDRPLRVSGTDRSRTAYSNAASMLIADDKRDLSSQPVYLSYYNAVRSCIYKTAQANKPDYFLEGEVCLVFILSRDGKLLDAGVIAEKSTRNPILQRHALSSIERSSPFPAFHGSMKEQRLTLRISISFEK
ncbi:MAG: hypothetical protein PHV77_04290 [Candidatus Omnitrophica bacterium]|nr:hypothetical protein [Candidatus Omnitrophota bacterium]